MALKILMFADKWIVPDEGECFRPQLCSWTNGELDEQKFLWGDGTTHEDVCNAIKKMMESLKKDDEKKLSLLEEYQKSYSIPSELAKVLHRGFGVFAETNDIARYKFIRPLELRHQKELWDLWGVHKAAKIAEFEKAINNNRR